MTDSIIAADIDRITPDRALEVAEMADEQLLDLVGRLDHVHFDAPTDCTGWTVADMIGHIIGAAKGNRSLLAGLADQAWGFRHARSFDGNALDALNDRQVRDHADLSPEERVQELAAALPPARQRVKPGVLLRALPVPLAAGSGSFPADLQRTVSFGQLMNVIYTRDVWMHTVDIERATGVKADRSGPLDRIIVHDVVGDWMQRHGRAVQLHLTGRSGGDFSQGRDGPPITLDAIEFCRTVAGRADGDGLLGTPVLF